MKNELIIAKAAVDAGLYSVCEVVKMIENGEEIPLHTISWWNRHGSFHIKDDEVGINVNLWRKREDGAGFYKVEASLYRREQLEESGHPP